MAVAALVPAAVVYREEQNVDWRVYALLATLDFLAWLGLVWLIQRSPNGAALADTWPIGVPGTISRTRRPPSTARSGVLRSRVRGP